MTIQEYTNKLGNVVKQLQGEKTDHIMVQIAVDAITLIKKRVQETGVDAEGAKYKSYSSTATLIGASSFVQKAAAEKVLGSKPKRKALEWRTVKGHRLAILPGGYKKIRELQGRQTAFVDFSVTNSMWNDISVLKNTRTMAEIGAKQDIEKKKLAGNTARRTDILDLNKEEIKLLTETYNLEVLKVFKENGL